MRFSRVASTCATLMLAAAPHAAADPIHITSGFLDMNPIAGPLWLSGAQGFTFSSGVDIAGGTFLPVDNCNFDPLHCRPGDTLNLRASWSGNDVTGTATLDGATYVAVGSLSSFSSMVVQFNGTAVLPALQSGPTVLTAPFLFSGTFFHPVPGAVNGFPATSDTLAGSGTTIVTLAPSRGFPGSWIVTHARYEFSTSDAAPTPEPGTLLLIGTGLVGAAAILRRRARKPPAL